MNKETNPIDDLDALRMLRMLAMNCFDTKQAAFLEAITLLREAEGYMRTNEHHDWLARFAKLKEQL